MATKRSGGGVVIEARALDSIQQYLDMAPEAATTAARIALNDTMRERTGAGWKLLQRAIEQEVAFPPGYVDEEKLFISRYASNNSLEVSLKGRHRPTSLARFALNGAPITRGRKGDRAQGGNIRVEVRRGVVRDMGAGAFLMRLRRGLELGENNANIGLAIRLKPGETIRNKKAFGGRRLDSNLFLLYGPSVDQVFRDASEPAIPTVLGEVEAEFFRQFVRLTK